MGKFKKRTKDCFTRIWIGSDLDLLNVTKGTKAIFLFQETIGDLHYDLIRVNGELTLDIEADEVVKFINKHFNDL